MPLAVGAAITLAGDPAKGGIAAAVELASMGIGSMLVSMALGKVTARSVAILASVVLVTAQLLTAYQVAQASWPGFLIGRTLVGLSEGVLFTICSAFTARAVRPDRAFTGIAFAQVIMNALIFGIMAVVNTEYSPIKVFLVLAAFSATAIFALVAAPNYRMVNETDPANRVGAAKTPLSPAAKVVLAGFAIYSAALFMLFSFVEDIGVNNGLSRAQIAGVLGMSSFTALFGPVITACIGLRFGRMKPIFVAIAFQIGASLIVVHSSDLAIWGAAELTSISLIYVLNPLFWGLASDVDPSGRTPALATAIMAMTAAFGPALSGVILSLTGSYIVLGWSTAAAYLLMSITIFGPLRAADRRASLALEPQRV